MRFLKLRQVPLHELTVFRAYPKRAVLSAIHGVAFLVFAVWVGWGKVFLWIPAGVGAWSIGVALLDVVRARNSMTWLAAVGRGNLYLHWRGYLHLDAGTEDEQVVEIPLDQIEAVRRVGVWSLGENEAYVERLELRLKADAPELAAWLEREQVVTAVSKNVQEPQTVHMVGLREVQVLWWARPKVKRMSLILESHGVRRLPEET